MERGGRPPPMTTWHHLALRMVTRGEIDTAEGGNLEPYLDGCSSPCSIGSKLLAVASNHFCQIKGSSC